MARLLILLLIAFLWAQEEGREQGVPTEKPREARPALRPQSLTLTGKVVSAEGEPLPGAYVKVVGTVQGVVAGANGEFRLVLLSPNDPIQLEATFVGYEPATLSVPLAQASQPITLTLQETGVRAQEVVISATRVSETLMNSPVTVLKMSAREVQEAPGLNFFQNVTAVKGFEQVSSSLTFQIVNARGFNSPNNPRFVHRLDGIEMQAPGLNFPVGAITAPGDLDIESVELLPGPASALYGPNAFNGILNVYSKDPFRFPGLSAAARIGVNHADRIDTTPQPLYDVAVRYAHTWNNRFGIKVFANYFDGHDWVAQDLSDRGNYVGAVGHYAIPGPDNPGYDAVNRYGDEARVLARTRLRPIWQLIGFGLGGGLPDDTTDLDFYVARTGYLERDIVRYDARILKGNVGAYYRISDQLQLSYTSFASTGATVYQSVNRYGLKDFFIHTHRLELAGPDFRVWAYATFEDAGNSFDGRFAALNVLRAAKPDVSWFSQYLLTYTGQLRRIVQTFGENPANYGIPAPGDHAAARAYANSARAKEVAQLLARSGVNDPRFLGLFSGEAYPEPGSNEFRRLLNQVLESPNLAQGGARFLDKSSLYHAEGHYDLSRRVRWVDLLVGGNFRYFLLNSQGTLFSDTAGPIGVWEYGAFAQVEKTFWNERLRLLGSLRYDKNVNFQGRFTPRVGALFALDAKKNHNLRASYQTGFRMPTLQAQYIDLDLGVFRYIGGLRASDEFYGIIQANYSLESVWAFQDSLAARTRGTSNPADYQDLLRKLPFENVKPEKVTTLEAGSRHLLTDRIFVDLDYAYSMYRDFLGNINFVGPKRYRQPDGSWQYSPLTPDSVQAGNYVTYRRYYNSSTPVSTHHFSVAVQYTISRQFFVNANFTYAEIMLTEEAKRDRLIPAFNTPKYRANVYFTGRELLRSRRVGFTVGYRWVNAYLFQEPFHERIIPTYQLVDLQVSYKIPKIKSQLRIGGQNVLNNRHIEIPGGPMLGSLYYLQWTYDPFLP